MGAVIRPGALTTHEEEPGAHGAREQEAGGQRLRDMPGAHHQRHGHAAEQEDAGVEPAEENFGVPTGGGKSLRVEIALDSVAEKKPAEKQHLGREENPHP